MDSTTIFPFFGNICTQIWLFYPKLANLGLATWLIPHKWRTMWITRTIIVYAYTFANSDITNIFSNFSANSSIPIQLPLCDILTSKRENI